MRLRRHRSTADHPVFRKVAALAHPNLLLIRRSWNDKTKRYSQWIGVDEVRRLRSFLGHSAGETGWRVVIVDRADDLNAERRQCAAEGSGRAAAAHAVPSGGDRRGTDSRHHPLPLPDASRHGFGSEDDLAKAVRAALERDDHEVDAKTLSVALALSQGSVRRALELATGEGIALYRDIVAAFARLPELDGPAAHKLAERLGGFGGDSERLDLFLSLLLGLMERLIRDGSDRRGRDRRGEGACQPLARPRDAAAMGRSLGGDRPGQGRCREPQSRSQPARARDAFTACSRRRAERQA